MRKLLLLMVAFGAVAVGCTGDDDDDDGGTPATLSGFLSGDDDDDGIVGGTVSEAGTSNSVTTGSAGAFTITVDADEEVFIKGEATGYYAAMRGVIVPASGLTGYEVNLPDATNVAAVEALLGVTLDPAKGILAINWNNTTTTAGGFSATISATADGSFVFGTSGAPQMGSTTIANAGDQVIFYNVDPGGSVTITPSVPGGETCVEDDGLTSYRVEGETITLAEFDCGS